jgi:hypothetical protein
MMMIKIGAATAAAVSLAIAVGHHQGSADPPMPQQAPAETSEDLFREQWARAAGIVLLMSAMAETMQPKAVATEKIAVAPIDKPVADLPKTMTDDPRPQRHRNICERHKMRKVLIRGGKSWRCKKG